MPRPRKCALRYHSVRPTPAPVSAPLHCCRLNQSVQAENLSIALPHLQAATAACKAKNQQRCGFQGPNTHGVPCTTPSNAAKYQRNYLLHRHGVTSRHHHCHYYTTLSICQPTLTRERAQDHGSRKKKKGAFAVATKSRQTINRKYNMSSSTLFFVVHV